MKNFYLHLIFLLFITKSISTSAQPVTANDYVRPYTEKFDYGSNMAAPSNGWSDETIAGIIRNAGGTCTNPFGIRIARLIRIITSLTMFTG